MICETCGGELGRGFDPITVPLVDDEGFPILDRNAHVQMVTLRLPKHRIPESMMPRNPWDPTGLVPSMCDHGLREHPNGLSLKYGGRSWVRSQYATHEFTCVVDLGRPRPDDLAEPRA